MTRRCKYCGANELPHANKCDDIVQKKGYCSVECLYAHTADKRIAAQEKKERKVMREAKEKLKSRGEYAKEAQTAFNAWIRERDGGQVCISCQKPPKKKNAGHYRSVGAAPELRFEPLNVHLQCEHCNTYLSSNAIDYRINLIKKIGADKLEWLEGPHEPKKYTIDDLKQIKADYKAKLKELKADSI